MEAIRGLTAVVACVMSGQSCLLRPAVMFDGGVVVLSGAMGALCSVFRFQIGPCLVAASSVVSLPSGGILFHRR